MGETEMKKINLLTLVFTLILPLWGQDFIPYYGNLSFDYSGAMNGTFNAELIQEDTLSIPTSGAVGTVISDENGTGVYITAFQPNEEVDQTYDFFLMVMRDDDAELEPQTFEVLPPDIEDPLNISATMLFVPEIDSSFVMDLLGPVFDGDVDTSNFVDYMLEALLEIIEISFLPISGDINLETYDVLSMSGSYNSTMLLLGLPPLFLTISNGEFDMAVPGADLIPPTPENFTGAYIEGDPDYVELSWEPVETEYFNHYTLYRAGADEIFLPIAELPSDLTTYLDFDELVSGGTYSYYVTSVTFFLIESAPSEIVVVDIPGGLAGDVNQDLTVDVLDIVIMVNFIMGGAEPNDYEFWASDLNGDGTIDVLDVVLEVNIVMGGGQ